jgi:drug/metabolite transporter (DMT)-like permease
MAAAAIFWSIGGLLLKMVPWSAMSIIGLRALFAAAVFAVYRKSLKIDLTPGNILAAVCMSLTTILFVLANKLTTAAAAVLLQFSAPIFILLVEFFFYKKRPSVSAAIAVLFTVLGMLLFFADRLDAGSTLGNILAITSGLTFAGVFLCNKRPDANPDHSLMLGFLINIVIGMPFAFFQTTADPVAWGAIIALGIVQVGLAYVFFSKGIKRTAALLACLITAIEPVLNPILVALFTKERPGPFAAAGGVLIVLTIVGYNIWVDKHPEKAKEAG